MINDSVVLIPKWMSDAVAGLCSVSKKRVVLKYADEQWRKRRIGKAISELRSFQCDPVLTKKQLKEVVLIIKDASITEEDFWHMDSGSSNEDYEGWFWKLRQAKEDKKSGLFDYFETLKTNTEEENG